MKCRQAICIAPLALLSSCMTAEVKGPPPPPPPPPPYTLSCTNDLSGHVYTGDMKNSAGVTLATVTLNFRVQGTPGFKHNVQMVPPPLLNLTPQDVECDDSSPPTTLTVYKSETLPPLVSKEATWTMLSVVPPGYAFTLKDPGGVLFPAGATGNFSQTQ